MLSVKATVSSKANQDKLETVPPTQELGSGPSSPVGFHAPFLSCMRGKDLSSLSENEPPPKRHKVSNLTLFHATSPPLSSGKMQQ